MSKEKVGTVLVRKQVVREVCDKACANIHIVREMQNENSIKLYQKWFNEETAMEKFLMIFGILPKKYTLNETKQEIENHNRKALDNQDYFGTWNDKSSWADADLTSINVLSYCCNSDIEEPIEIDASIWSSILWLSNMSENQIKRNAIVSRIRK